MLMKYNVNYKTMYEKIYMYQHNYEKKYYFCFDKKK